MGTEWNYRVLQGVLAGYYRDTKEYSSGTKGYITGTKGVPQGYLGGTKG